MNRQECTIVVERLADGRFRASCPMVPDCAAVGPSAEAARAAVEQALARLLGPGPTNAIDAAFARLRGQGRKAFLPFVTAGDPDLPTTAAAVRTLAEAGADLIELGFPYSDPIADGPVIQASFTRALDRGVRLDAIFDLVRELTGSGVQVPLVGMLSYSLVLRRGPAAFVDRARQAGLSGLIVPDLPIDEADELTAIGQSAGLKLIQLVTPTTPPDRAARIARSSTGFLYCVSVTGITGERHALPAGLAEQLRRLRGVTDLPLCVGFGIGAPEQARALRDLADGVIVGSAIVRRLEQASRRPVAEVLAELAQFARDLIAALNPPVTG